MRQSLFILFISVCSSISAQKDFFSYQEIPQELLVSVNSVLRLEEHVVSIPDQSKINVVHKRVVTVLNKKGNSDVHAYLYYDDVSRVKDIKATIYDKLGAEVKRFKQRDFRDASAVDGISLFTDSRILYLDYTPTSYPYTIVFESERISKNTVEIPSFYTNSSYYSSTQERSLEINYDPSIGMRYRMTGAVEAIKLEETTGRITVQVQNIPSIIPEDYSPGFKNIVGTVHFATNDFHLEGVNGNASDWNVFGKWMNDNLLAGTQELPDETVVYIKNLVADMPDKLERARAVYDYVQGKTRYISVQVGIGGWKPMLASQVDKLGYGDCKALSNYTKSLLEVAEVPSYYTVLYGGNEKRDIVSDFAGIQGNHAILSIPDGDNYVWLECTDQNVPFGFIAGFTDDRDVLVVTPDGGEVVHSKKYSADDNYQKIIGNYTVDEHGSIKAAIEIKSGGIQYGDRYHIALASETDQKKHYYNFWQHINNLDLERISLENDKEQIEFIEKIEFTAENYATFAGKEMLLPINLFNRYGAVPDRIKDRKLAVDISRGFSDWDEVEIKIPEGYTITAIPENVKLSSPYGEYTSSLEKLSEEVLVYKRYFNFHEGFYEKEAYTDFRKFIRSITRYDKQKIVLNKKSD